MNLEQFKNEMDTDARKRCEQQEATIKKLHEENRKLSEDVIAMKKTVHQIQNRCHALTLGAMCRFCGFFETCNSRTKSGRKEEF